MRNPIGNLKTLEFQARSSGDTRRAERLRDDIARLERIKVGINIQFQHMEYQKRRR